MTLTELYQELIADIEIYLGVFAVVTVLAVVTRGKAALAWSKSMKASALVNFGMIKFNAIFGGVFFLAYYFIERLYTQWGLPQIPREAWADVPKPLIWLALFLIYDFAVYWVHRLLHHPVLWPLHAVHHSDEDLHFLSWGRGHAMEQAFIGIGVFLISAWMGLRLEEFALLVLIKGLHQFYVHANIDWDHGPFKLLLASPQYHRWHHANEEAAWDKNFASIFPFYDKLFGTYYYPHSAVNVPTGFEGTPGNDFVGLLLYPFKEWIGMIRNKFRKPAPQIEAAE